jgi:hypothetical protein
VLGVVELSSLTKEENAGKEKKGDAKTASPKKPGFSKAKNS